jgi:hypothetical protein
VADADSATGSQRGAKRFAALRPARSGSKTPTLTVHKIIGNRLGGFPRLGPEPGTSFHPCS